MKTRKISITGSAGFIDFKLAKYLSKDNQVFIIDDLSKGHIENIKDLILDKKVEFIEGSFRDLSLLRKTFKNIHYVFHEAALPSVPRSIKYPPTTNNVNINGTLNALCKASFIRSFDV